MAHSSQHAARDPFHHVWESQWTIVAILFIALLVRLPGLTESLWYDELWSTHVVIGRLGDLLHVVLHDVHPPLYSMAMFVWIKLFGDSELAVRLPALIAGLGTLALMPALGRALATTRAGVVGAALLAISPVHIWYSQEARHYAVMMLVCVALPIVLHSLEAKPSRARGAGYVLLAIVGGLLHYYVTAVVGVLAVFAWWRRKCVVPALTGLLASALSVSMVVWIRMASGTFVTSSPYLGAFDGRAAIELFGRWFLLAGTAPTSVLLAALGLMFVVAAALAFTLSVHGRLLRHQGRASIAMSIEPYALMLAVPAFLFMLNLAGAEHSYIQRSALTSLPFFALLIGLGLDSAPATAGRVLGGAIAIGGVSVLVTYWSLSDDWTVYKPNPDWRSAARTIEALRAQGYRNPIVIGTTPSNSLLYYVPGAAKCAWPPSEIAKRGTSRSWRARIRRLVESSTWPTCGENGTATARLYMLHNASYQDALAVLDLEQQNRALIVRNAYWAGSTDSLSARLARTQGIRIEETARSKGLLIQQIFRSRSVKLSEKRPLE